MDGILYINTIHQKAKKWRRGASFIAETDLSLMRKMLRCRWASPFLPVSCVEHSCLILLLQWVYLHRWDGRRVMMSMLWKRQRRLQYRISALGAGDFKRSEFIGPRWRCWQSRSNKRGVLRFDFFTKMSIASPTCKDYSPELYNLYTKASVLFAFYPFEMYIDTLQEASMYKKKV